jgi:hypothetical protein
MNLVMKMTNRNIRDTERRNYIKEKIQENLEMVVNDPESLFAQENEK